jgi:PhnB protein
MTDMVDAVEMEVEEIPVLAKKAEKAAAKARKRARKAEKKAWKKARPDKRTPWISPNLWVDDVRAAAEFYVRAFGFEIGEIIDGPDGKAVHAFMKHRRGVLMLGTSPWKPGATAASAKACTCSLYVYTSDVDTLAARARGEGCTIQTPPTNEFWGDRCTRLVDPYGHQWMFATSTGSCGEMSDASSPPPLKAE